MMESKQGRRELLEVIAQQKEQISRYESRLKDVVRAYKGLAKEKETLETSLKAITAAVNEEKDAEAEKQKTDTEDIETDTESIAESVSSDVTSASGSSEYFDQIMELLTYHKSYFHLTITGLVSLLKK